MNDPTVLRAFGFVGEHDAPRSARRLTAAARTSPVLDDAAVVTWPADHRRPLAWQARELAVGHRLSGAFWGLLFAQLFLLPLSLRTPPALPVTGIDDGLCWLGVDIGFVHAVREHVRPAPRPCSCWTPGTPSSR